MESRSTLHALVHSSDEGRQGAGHKLCYHFTLSGLSCMHMQSHSITGVLSHRIHHSTSQWWAINGKFVSDHVRSFMEVVWHSVWSLSVCLWVLQNLKRCAISILRCTSGIFRSLYTIISIANMCATYTATCQESCTYASNSEEHLTTTVYCISHYSIRQVFCVTDNSCTLHCISVLWSAWVGRA